MGPTKTDLVGPNSFVNHYVLGARIEAESGEGLQSVGERLFTGARQDEVNVRDPDVVRPDVDLLHG